MPPTPDWLTDMGNLGDDILLGLDGSTRPHVIHYADKATADSMIAAGTDVSLYGQNLTTMSIPASPSPPVLIDALVIEGSNPTIGGMTNLQQGSWGGVPDPTVSYQWFAEDTAIGAPQDPGNVWLVFDASHEGKTIHLKGTATNAHGSAEAQSNVIGPITAAP